MSIPTITQLPPAPILGADIEENFSRKVDDLLTALPGWIGELNAFAPALVLAATNFYNATSGSPVTIGTGAKNFTIETGKAYVTGQFVLIADEAAPTANWMLGQVTALDSEAGALSVAVTLTKGAGQKAAWVIGLAGVNRPLNDGDYGDVSVSGDGTVYTVRNNTISNAKLADMATARIKGRTSAGAGDPEDLTGTQVTAMLDVFTPGAKGLVPGGSGGNLAFYLRGDGVWGSPSSDASAWTEIANIPLANAGDAVSFVNIPQAYSDLSLELSSVEFAGTGDFTVELSSDGVTYRSPAVIYTKTITSAPSLPFDVSLVLFQYVRGFGAAVGGLRNRFSTGGFPDPNASFANIGTLPGMWSSAGGIKAIRIRFTAAGANDFLAGTARLFLR